MNSVPNLALFIVDTEKRRKNVFFESFSFFSKYFNIDGYGPLPSLKYEFYLFVQFKTPAEFFFFFCK